MTDRYAVLGQPIEHSRSPLIHSRFAAQTEASMTYVALEVAPDALAETLSRLHQEHWQGLNLTLPHKAAAMALCVSHSAAAEQAGASNTLLRSAAGWHAENTDGVGLVVDLRVNLGIELRGRRIAVIGAGGAARGILAPLLAEAPAELAICNRNPWKPEEIAAALKPLGNIVPRTNLSLKGDRFDLIINATSAGHHGEVPRLPPALFAPGALAYDLNYGAAATPFLDWAGAQGASRCQDGIGMLVEQAAESFRFWRGNRPDTAAVLAELRGQD